MSRVAVAEEEVEEDMELGSMDLGEDDDVEEEEVEEEEIEEEEAEEEEAEEEEEEEAEEVEAEEEEEEEPSPKRKKGTTGKKVKAKKRGPPKKRRPPANRMQKIPNYDTHLRRTRKPLVEGEEPKRKIKLRPGTKAGRETKYLQDVATSGTFLAVQPVRRTVKEALTSAALGLQVEAVEFEELNETTGKHFATPLNKASGLPVGTWRISSAAIEKIRAGAQNYVDKMAEVSHDIHVARKSVTVTGEDVELAHKFVSVL